MDSKNIGSNFGLHRDNLRKFCLLGWLACSTLALFVSEVKAEEFDPVGIFLTWQHDPTTSITIDWHTVPEDGDRETKLQYRVQGSSPWRETIGLTLNFPHTDRFIHRVELRFLEPGTTYQFRFGEDSRTYSFDTMPADLTEPLVFVTGGDGGIGEDFRRMNNVVMKYDPSFILWGGDIVYDNGDPINIDRWYDWYDGIKETLIDEDGKVTPIIVAIGNHELFRESHLYNGIGGHSEHSEAEAQAYLDKHNLWNGKPTYFFQLFAFPGRPSYSVLDFGDYMSIFAMDTQPLY